MALRRDEFVLHYQPRVNLESGAVTGIEALIRWNGFPDGPIQPGQFLSVAEEMGLMVPIGQWVMRQSCRQMKLWVDAGLQTGPVSVNVSAIELQQTGFAAGVRLILQETRLDPRLLQIEIAESLLLNHGKDFVALLRGLEELGVRLSIDCFGTGHSNPGDLKRFPIDVLKIDQSFMRDLAVDADVAGTVKAIIEMGNHLPLRVVATGVETSAQLAILNGLHCKEGQGFRFAPPIAADEIRHTLSSATHDAARYRHMDVA
jgi:diguanylate cyclase